MKTKPQAAQGKPGAGTGIEWAEKRRTIFRAEAPENGPYYRYDPTTGARKERPPGAAAGLAEGGEALGGPAIRHVAFLGATPPVKRNLGAWNPELYTPSDNGEAPRRALPKGVELVTFSENAADDCEVGKHEPAA